MTSSDAVAPSMDPAAGAPSHLEMSHSSRQSEDALKAVAATAANGHVMSADDPDNPQNWPYYKRVYVSLVAFVFAWVV